MARTGSIKSKIILLVLIPFVIWITMFELLPIAGMVISSFQNDSGQGFTLGQYFKIFSSSIYTGAIRNSIFISLYSSLAGIVIALFCAYSITRFSQKTRDILLTLSNMVSNFAGVPLAFAYIILLGNNGMFTLLFKHLGWHAFESFDLYSVTGLMLVYVYFQVPLAILLLYPTYYGIREEWREAASLLGASNWQFWRHVGLPVLMPGVIGTFSILMANALGGYATAYALTGNNVGLMTIRIAANVSGDIFPKFELGSALAVVLAVTMLIAMLINEYMLRLSRRRGI